MIRRIAQLVLLVAAGSAAWTMRAPAPTVELPLEPEPAPPAFFGCVGRSGGDVGGGLAIGSTVRGSVTTGLVAGGGGVPVVGEIDPAGGAVVPFESVRAAGAFGIIAELPTSEAGTVSVLTGPAGTAAASCTVASVTSVIAAGGSTGTGQGLQLVVTNPYALDALVAVSSSSEVGDDSAGQLASVLVPANTTVVEDLAAILPLRRSLSVRVAVERGAVHAALLQTLERDVAMVEAVEPAQDWWLPFPSPRNLPGRLVVSTDSLLPVEVQVDTYRGGTLTEAVATLEIPPRGQLDIPQADLGGPGAGLRVSADAPIVATLVLDGEGGRGVTPATPLLSAEWILAGAGGLGGRAWVFNPGEVPAELVLQPLAPANPARAAVVPPRSVAPVNLGDPGVAGYLLRSSSEIAAVWVNREGGVAVATGTPIAVLAE
jgi:hypothetical protein